MGLFWALSVISCLTFTGYKQTDKQTVVYYRRNKKLLFNGRKLILVERIDKDQIQNLN